MPGKRAYQLEPGGIPRRVFGAGILTKQRIERAAHTLVVRTTEGCTASSQTNAWWVTDLRRGRRNIYGGLLRFIDHLVKRNIPMETALEIPRWIEAYIRDVYTGMPQDDAVQMLRTGEFQLPKAG